MNVSHGPSFSKASGQLSVLFGDVQRHLADVFRGFERAEADAAKLSGRGEAILLRLDACEQAVVHSLRAQEDLDVGERRVVVLIQISSSLRQLVQSANDFLASGVSLTLVPAELAERLHRMAELTQFQISLAHHALVSGDAAQAKRSLAQDVEIDRWHDLLLKDCFEDVAEAGQLPAGLSMFLAFARLLERVGGLSVALGKQAILAAETEAQLHLDDRGATVSAATPGRRRPTYFSHCEIACEVDIVENEDATYGAVVTVAGTRQHDSGPHSTWSEAFNAGIDQAKRTAEDLGKTGRSHAG